MMVDVNLVMVAGRLVRDPELKYPTGNIPLCSFTVATTKRFAKSDGSKGEETVFVEVNAWRRTAEICAQFLKKGRSVLVVGALQQNRWTDKEGKKKSKIRITANNVQFLGGKPKEDEPENSGDAGPQEEDEAAE